MSKEHFYFSKSDRRASIALLIIIILVHIARYEVNKHYNSLPVVRTDTIVWQQVKKNETKKGYDGYSTNYRKNKSTGDNIRNNGDKTTGYEKSNDFSNVEGRDYYGNERNGGSQKVSKVWSDSVFQKQSIYPKKLPFGTVIDINTADTSLLKCIPGIGSYYAGRIVEYRSSLGGYTNVEQLSEIKNLPDSVQGWFKTGDSIDIIRIEVNGCSLKQLMSHPYISFYQARAITEYRRAHGEILSLSQLSMLPEFSDADIKRLSPYLKF